MRKFNPKTLIFLIVIVFAVFLRFYRLEDVPSGFHQDEVSQAYNAFSIATTGHDRYGQYLPILFRSFGSYQPSVYTYLSVLPVSIFGNTVFAARFLSAISGVIVVIATYFIIKNLFRKNWYGLAILASFVVATSPWAIHFSRRVVEGNLGLMFFIVALFVLIKSLNKINLFPVAMFLFGISTQAYYSERVIAILFIPLFLIVYRKYFLKYKKVVVLGLAAFVVTQLPHIWLITSGAYARRFDQVSYFANDPGDLPKAVYLVREFSRHFFQYLSPSSLFADTGSDLARVSPELGVFFSWMFVPFLSGLYFFVKVVRGDFLKVMGLLAVTSLVPASLTGDVFYPLRTLEYLWCVSIIIALGIYYFSRFILNNRFKVAVISLLAIYSFVVFYISYFVLFKYETIEHVASTYTQLDRRLRDYKGNIVIDGARDTAIGLRMAYFRAYDPKRLSLVLRPQLTSDYYSSEVSSNEIYTIDNIVVKTLDWGKDSCGANTLIIGDPLAISAGQAREHGLAREFDIKGADGHIFLSAYKTTFECN